MVCQDTAELMGSLLFDLHRACREQPVNRYQDYALERVKMALPFDRALWMTGALFGDGRADVHTSFLHNLPAQMLTDWAAVSGEHNTTFRRKLFTTPGKTMICVVERDFDTQLIARSKHYEVAHIMSTTGADPVAGLIELISFYRADPSRPFSEDERRFKESLTPHLIETWRVNRMWHLTRVEQPIKPAACCRAAADARGILHLVEPGFTHLLHEEWPAWQGPVLPREFTAAIAANTKCYAGKSIMARFTDVHELRYIRVRRRHPVDLLSGREREVAQYFSDGMTHKEIAKLLQLSPATVRNNLSNSYAKLNIGNKAELANVLREFD